MEHTCIRCGRTAPYQRKNGDWWCARSHNGCPTVQESKRKSCIEKYGTEHPLRNASVQETRKQNNIEKYGVDHPYKLGALQERVAATNRDKYGVDNPFAAKSVQDKIKCTLLKTYGVENVSHSPEVQLKRESTFLKKYGTTSYLGTKESQIKSKATCMRKYGVENVTQYPMYYRIMQKARFKLTKVELEGKIFILQGVEGRVLTDLIRGGIRVSEIENSPSKIPPIWYIKPNGKKARYYPDFFIPHLNWVIEGKCNYTFGKDKEINLLKRAACIAQGYKFNFLIR